MGPIMQERAASATLKRVSSKEKIRIKNYENTVPVPSSKKSNKSKKTGGQVKNGLPGPGQEKDTAPPVHRGIQSRGGRAKSASTTRNTCKGLSPQLESPVKPLVHKQSSTRRKEEKREPTQQQPPASSPCYSNHSRGGGPTTPGKSRQALSLPLSPIAGLHHTRTPPLPTALPYHHHHHHQSRREEAQEDSDSASDLSDSERLPVLPSPCTPCTPPHFNLRAEVINTADFPPDFPGPGDDNGDGGVEKRGYSYPDFLPPPFSSWSLRQLAVFLHTECRGAPRPKPVGPLEKYLERLLQLEWLQIQTVQAESSRAAAAAAGAGSRPRQLGGFPPSAPSPASHHPPPRPHTAPSTRLNSPKGLRQGGPQRAFPFATPGVASSNPPSPAAAQPPPHHQPHTRPPACPQCHVRYPRCNGSCSGYAYQRHCRLSPLSEHKARPGGAPARRSESEGRASTEASSPGSPSPGGKSHARHMQAAGNVRKPPRELRASGDTKGRAPKPGAGVTAGSETDVKGEPGGGAGKMAATEKRVLSGCKRELGTSRRVDRDLLKAEAAAAQASKSATKRAAKEPQPHTKVVGKQNGKAKNVHFVAK